MLFEVILSLAAVGTVQGVSLTCVNKSPKDQASLNCTCTNPAGNGVQWRVNTVPSTSCLGTSDSCFPPLPGYSSDFTVNQFYLLISPYSASDCATYNCKDGTTAEEQEVTTSIKEYDVNSVTTSAPSADTDGQLTVTTGCVFPLDDITVTWYIIKNGKEEDFTADRPVPIQSFDRSTCTNTCNGDENKKVTNGFTHTQYNGTDSVEAEYKVVVTHKAFSDPTDVFTWKSAKYRVKAASTSASSCKCKCKCICRPHQIGGISTGVLGPLILPVAVGGRLQGCFSQTVGLAVNGIGFVLDIVSLGLSSSVQADNCCEECKEGEDCCNEQDCCEDEECCDDEKCCPSWIMGCSIAFIVISCVFAIVAIVIAVLLFKNRIGPLENGNNFCCGNNDGDGHDGHDDGHDDGNAHRKPRVHSEMEERHRETHSNRVNSDGAVSRQDVDFQENKGNIHGRPMPPILPQDRKGRGLSANYDDNHPMISVGIPDKKAGQLEPMEEEPRKKKKKKKKNVDEEDN